MNRALYSGVSGLKTHQTKMDVVGNNIANVNTFGFKASRVTFKDVYYQTVSGASAASSTRGGTNASSIGYGSTVGSIDLLMGQSSFSMTDSTMDLAIDGEGFFQVQDAAGNKYYTRAGALTFDSSGNLVDAQGNFVLGINGSTLNHSEAGSSLIQLSLPSVEATASSGSSTINGITYSVSASNRSEAGNISMQFIVGSNMTDSVRATAQVGTSGIVVTLNPNESFDSIADLNQAVNEAINTYMLDNVGTSHEAGDFTISMSPSDAADWPLTGEEICSSDFSLQSGTVDGWPTSTIAAGFSPTAETGSGFSADGALSAFNIEYVPATGDDAAYFKVTAVIDGENYSANIDEAKTESGTMKLQGPGGTNDYMVFKRPGFNDLMNYATTEGIVTGAGTVDDPYAAGSPQDALAGITPPPTITVSPASPSKCLGLSSSKIVLGNGTEGGAQGIESLTGIAIGGDGTIVATHAQLGDIVVGRIDIVTFANPEGLVQSSGTYFTTSANSGEIQYCVPGSNGAGSLVSGSLELSNVDLSKEFSDMITTQRGYQACSRLITVSDEMLEELVNLKR